MTTGSLAYPGGMEIGTFEEHILGLFGGTRFKTAEHTGNAHRLLGVAYHKVAFRQLALHSIEGYKGSSFGEGAHYNLSALYLVGIEAVHRLAIGVEYVVCYIHYVVYGAQAYYLQFVLQPFGTLLHGYTLYAHTGITHTGLAVLNYDVDGQ